MEIKEEVFEVVDLSSRAIKSTAVKADKYAKGIHQEAEYVSWGDEGEYSILYIPIDCEDDKGWNYMINGKLYTSLFTNPRYQLVEQSSYKRNEQLSLF